MSNELSGGINQVLKYKHTVLRHYMSLVVDTEEDERFEAFSPKSMLIIGNYEKEINETIKKEAFELFRSSLSDVQIVTFDELFKKVDTLVKLLEDASGQVG